MSRYQDPIERARQETRDEQTPDNRGERPSVERSPEEEYAEQLEGQERLEQRIAESQAHIEENREQIQALREKLNLPEDPGLETASDQYLASLEKQEQEGEKKLEEVEDKFLGAPEGKGQNPEQLTSRKMQIAQEQEAAGKEIEREARELMVKKYIESATEQILEDFQPFLDESANAEQAQVLIQQKTEAEVEAAARDFIENGGEPNFGFSAHIQGAEFDGADGERQRYVTEYTLTFDESGSKSKTTDEERGELVDLQARRAMKQAEKDGDLEEVDKAA